MCGIIGINGTKQTASRLILALERLEYRGYDSSGVACLDENKVEIIKAVGKVSKLKEKLIEAEPKGTIGIAHTRWATHGHVTEVNAHPHYSKNFALAHNGVIENHMELRDFLTKEGFTFKTETDSEVIVQLIEYFYQKEKDIVTAINKTRKMLIGSFAVIAICKEDKENIYAMRFGTPLGIGVKDNESFVGSDAYSISPFCDNITFMEDGDYAKISKGSFILYDKNSKIVHRQKHNIDLHENNHSKGDFEHFMLKEIHEEPSVSHRVFENYVRDNKIAINLDKIISSSDIEHINLIACGTSYYAAMTAKFWFEEIANIRTSVELASEFRTRENFFVDEKTLNIFISQSGETADTLESLKILLKHQTPTMAITNAEQSAIARLADINLPILAGAEIGVASTKAYINQLAVLALLSLKIAKDNNRLTKEIFDRYLLDLTSVPKKIAKIIENKKTYINLATEIKDSKSILFIGRANCYPTALEGALKLKELSYIHAEGIAGGELKHGPIALIDKDMIIISIAPHDQNFPKIASNLQTVYARKGKIILLSDQKGINELGDISEFSIEVDKTDTYSAPFCYAIPLQLIAYYTSLAKGLNVDQPRNLAKSVTVE